MAGFSWAVLAQASQGGGMDYFKTLVWPGGGYIGLLLWAMSIVTLAVIIQYFIQIRKTTIMPEMVQQQIQGLFENKQYREAIEVTAAEPSMLSYVVHAALSEAAHGYGAMERAMEEASEERTAGLLRKIEWLNLIGNVSPMLGLLGTVWGMINAFMAIVEASGMPSPEKLAYSIGIALVTTLLGLSVAIPALAVYAIMRNRIDSLSNEVVMAAQELISVFRPAPKTAAGGGAS
ncbi:MAG: MotA/TolQ/ExbB proton channel family protein [Planctomycetes bacterium]|nr:MotA/TolQ/ExbB proton channel family protein [Planctomycetota bacterium]